MERGANAKSCVCVVVPRSSGFRLTASLLMVSSRSSNLPLSGAGEVAVAQADDAGAVCAQVEVALCCDPRLLGDPTSRSRTKATGVLSGTKNDVNGSYVSSRLYRSRACRAVRRWRTRFACIWPREYDQEETRDRKRRQRIHARFRRGNGKTKQLLLTGNVL